MKNQNKNVSFALKVGLIGMFGGFFGGLLGIGGSFLVIPFLIGILGLSHHRAHASALPVAFIAGFASLGFYLLKGHFDLAVSMKVLIGSLIGVLVGARLMRVIRGEWLSVGFGFFLFLTAIVFIVNVHQTATSYSADHHGLWIPLLLGFFAGVASGLFGAGGGTIVVPGAVMFLHFSEQAAQGISLFVIIPTTLLGAIAHYREGNLSLKVVPYLMLSAFFGGLLGGYWAVHTHVAVLRWLLVIVLLYIGSRNIYKYGFRKLSFSTVPKGNKDREPV